jgi:hypothetical protein
MAVDELVLSIASAGFERLEPLIAVAEGENYIVIEGNRRLAAAKILSSKSLQAKLRVEGFPQPSDAALSSIETLPVVVTSRKRVWQYVGFKHVNGPQTWQSIAKAEYIAQVHERDSISLGDIAQQIGDRNATVERLYHGFCVLRQAERAGVFDRQKNLKGRFAFSHLYTALDYPAVQKQFGISESRRLSPNPIPASKLPRLAEWLVWIYGDASTGTAPLVRSQNPDLKVLVDVAATERGSLALRRGLPLAAAREASIGDQELLLQAIQEARDALVKAIGYAVHGAKSAKVRVADIEELADLVSTLQSGVVSSKRRARR